MAFGETFFAPSSYGDAIGDAVLSRAMERIHAMDGLLTIHAEEVSESPDTGMISHNHIESPEGELQAVKAVRRLNKARYRLHFCHLSTKRSIDAASGTVEVTPHHLFLSLEDFEDANTYGKVDPPPSHREGKKTPLGMLGQDRYHCLRSCSPSRLGKKPRIFPVHLQGFPR